MHFICDISTRIQIYWKKKKNPNLEQILESAKIKKIKLNYEFCVIPYVFCPAFQLTTTTKSIFMELSITLNFMCLLTTEI